MRTFGVPMEPSESCFLGIGQGAMQATPLQMANVASAVINGGTLYKPQIVREIRSPNGHVVKRFAPEVIRRVPVTPESLAAVRAGMAQGHRSRRHRVRLGDRGLTVFGKDGHRRNRGRQRPEHDVVHRVGAERHPKIAMAVFVDRSGGYGAQVAAPIARQILVEYFHKKP